MQRQPIAMLIEKNACPIAVRMVEKVIFVKSGLKRNVRPSCAPSVNMEKMTNISMMMNSSGIRNFANFSMPFFTPRMIIKWERRMKIMV